MNIDQQPSHQNYMTIQDHFLVRLQELSNFAEQIPDRQESDAALQLIENTWQELKAITKQYEETIAFALARAEVAADQRDMAIRELSVAIHNNDRRYLERWLADEIGISHEETTELLNILIGDSALWVSQYTKMDAIAALQKLAIEMIEERDGVKYDF